MPLLAGGSATCLLRFRLANVVDKYLLLYVYASLYVYITVALVPNTSAHECINCDSERVFSRCTHVRIQNLDHGN